MKCHYIILALYVILSLQNSISNAEEDKSMSNDTNLPYAAIVKYRKGETLSFKDFAFTYLRQEQRNFTISGVVRSNARQIFEIAFTDDCGKHKTIAKEFAYGFPGGLLEGFTFATTRRNYFSVKIIDFYDQGGSLEVNPSASVIEKADKEGEFTVRKIAELDTEVELAGNTVLAYPEFDLTILKAATYWVTMSAEQKKAALERARAYYTENHIALPNEYKISMESSEAMKTLHIVITFRLTNGNDVATTEIEHMMKGEVKFRSKLYSIDLTSIPFFEPGTEALQNQKIIVRNKKSD